MEKPSYISSTFSIMSLAVVLAYAGLCVYLKDVSNLKEVTLILLSVYGAKKGFEMTQPKPTQVINDTTKTLP